MSPPGGGIFLEHIAGLTDAVTMLPLSLETFLNQPCAFCCYTQMNHKPLRSLIHCSILTYALTFIGEQMFVFRNKCKRLWDADAFAREKSYFVN